LETETKVITVCILAIIVLIIFIATSYLHLSIIENKEYSVAFGNTDTFNFYKDGDLTTVSNNEDNSKSLSLYGLSTVVLPESKIFASLFSDKDNDIINFEDIVFGNQRVSPLQVDSDRPTIVQVSVKNLDLGLYHGWFYITGPQNYSIPITISTVPMLVQSVLIIIIGAISTIAILELKKYVDRKNKFKTRDALYEEIGGKGGLDDNIIGFSQSADPADEELLLSAKIQRESKMQAAILADLKGKDMKYRYSGLAAKLRQAALSLVPGLFAIIVGVAAFLNNDYVISIVELNFQDVIILFGLGAGIESIKALFDRS
jgi:hypothetical protein